MIGRGRAQRSKLRAQIFSDVHDEHVHVELQENSVNESSNKGEQLKQKL